MFFNEKRIKLHFIEENVALACPCLFSNKSCSHLNKPIETIRPGFNTWLCFSVGIWYHTASNSNVSINSHSLLKQKPPNYKFIINTRPLAFFSFYLPGNNQTKMTYKTSICKFFSGGSKRFVHYYFTPEKRDLLQFFFAN